MFEAFLNDYMALASLLTIFVALKTLIEKCFPWANSNKQVERLIIYNLLAFLTLLLFWRNENRGIVLYSLSALLIVGALYHFTWGSFFGAIYTLISKKKLYLQFVVFFIVASCCAYFFGYRVISEMNEYNNFINIQMYLIPASLYIGFIIALLSAVCVDTWATKIGTLFRVKTYNILTLKAAGQDVSGIVSASGILGSLLGALVIGLSGSFWIEYYLVQYFIVILLVGLLGSLFDSALGASIQTQYKYQICWKITEKNLITEVMLLRKAIFRD